MGQSELGWVRGFSLAATPVDERVLDVLGGTFGQGVADALIARFTGEVTQDGTGIVELISEWCCAAPSFEEAWDPAFGRAELALAGLVDPVDAAIRIALKITESGHPGGWRSRFSPTTMRLQHLLLIGVEEITVSDDTGALRVAARCGEEIVDCWRDEASGVWRSVKAPSVATFGLTRAMSLLCAGPEQPESLSEVAPVEGLPHVEDIDAAVVAHFQDSLALLEQVAYSQWVEGVLRSVLVTARAENVLMTSGSTNSRPGLVQMSFPATTVDIAETLVHESAHQYFNLLRRSGDFDDGSDGQLYWSPAARQHRPLTRILIAYHAFGNVMRLYEAMRAADIEDGGYVEQNVSTMRAKLAELDQPLRGNPALTDLGRAVYQSLADELESTVWSAVKGVTR